MENKKLILGERSLIKQVGTSISITNKILSNPNETFLIPYRKKDKWGFCLKDKRIVIDCIYEDVFPFDDRKARVKRNGKWGIINLEGQIITDMIYESISEFFDGMAMAYLYTPSPERERKFGFIDSNGKVSIPFIYDDARSFSEGIAMVEKDQKIGFINSEGNLIIDFIYDRSYDDGENIGFDYPSYVFKEGFCKVSLSPLTFGIINEVGKVVVPFDRYKILFPFSEGLASVAKFDKINMNLERRPIWGFIDRTGNEVIECQYKFVSAFSEGYAVVKKDKFFGFIDTKGKLAIPCIYSQAMPFSEGVAPVMIEIKGNKEKPISYKWGCIDKNGKTIIPFIYEGRSSFYDAIPYVTPCREGLIAIGKNGKYGHIDKMGNEIIRFKYEWTHPFKNGLSLARLHGDYTKDARTYIDKQGNEFYED